MKLDLLTNATVVDDAIRFVSDHKNEKTRKNNSKIPGSVEVGKKDVINTALTNQFF